MEDLLHIDLLFANQSHACNKPQFERNRGTSLVGEYKKGYVDYRESALRKAAVDGRVDIAMFRAQCSAAKIQKLYRKHVVRETGAHTIQHAYRVHYRKRCEAASKIAEAARPFIARSKANRMKMLTTKVQARWRMIRETRRLKMRLADRASVKLNSQLSLFGKDGQSWNEHVVPQRGSLQDIMKIVRCLSTSQLDRVCDRIIRGLASVRPLQSLVYAIQTLQSLEHGDFADGNEAILNECPHQAETVDNDHYYNGLHDFITVTNRDLLLVLQTSLYYLPRLDMTNRAILQFMTKMLQVQLYFEKSRMERRVHKVDGVDDLRELIEAHSAKAETFWRTISNCRICCKDPCAEAMHNSNGFTCNSTTCVELAKNYCEKSLECGHLCQGTKTHCNCMPCIQEECGSGQSTCWLCNSLLGQSPCTALSCGHIFHHHCLLESISKVRKGDQKYWRGPFGTCLLCKILISKVDDTVIDPELKILREFDDGICTNIIVQLHEMTTSQFNEVKKGDLFIFLLSCAVDLKGDVCKPAPRQADSKEEQGPSVELAWAKGVGYGTGSTNYSDIWDVQEFLEADSIRWATVSRLLKASLAYLDRLSTSDPESLLAVREVIRKSNVMTVIENCLGLSSEDRVRHADALAMVLTLIATIISHESLRPLLTDRMLESLQSLHKAQEILMKTASGDEEIHGDMEMIRSRLLDCMQGFSSIRQASESANKQVLGADGDALSSSKPTLELYSKFLKDKLLTFHNFRDECDDARFLHHYAKDIQKNSDNGLLANKRKLKKIARDISDLTNNLPFHVDSSIFCAVDESRPDVIRFLVTGPKDTPYEGGCFQFDMYCPAEYPNEPPVVNMCTNGNGTMRFNPNLYEDGYVCLSLLGTWEGEDGETWDPLSSTLLQVLVSIQALIFVPEPYFNEPGLEDLSNQPEGLEESAQYNRDICEGTVRYAIIDQLKNPTPGFEDVIRTHFSLKREEILGTVKMWGQDKLCNVSSHVDELKELLEALPPPKKMK